MFLDVSEGVTVAANKLPMGAFEILISPIVNIWPCYVCHKKIQKITTTTLLVTHRPHSCPTPAVRKSKVGVVLMPRRAQALVVI